MRAAQTNRDYSENLNFEPVWAALRETDRIIMEGVQQMQETDRIVQENAQQIEKLRNSFSEMVWYMDEPHLTVLTNEKRKMKR